MPNLVSVDFTSNATQSDPLLVSRKQACAMLGEISVSQLRRLIKAGELHPVFLNASSRPRRSGKLYFRTSELVSFVERRSKSL
jgi:hypothetical protein